MTQFIMVRAQPSSSPAFGICFLVIREEWLAQIAKEYFGTSKGCRLVVDDEGRAEPLIDDVWEAQRNGEDPFRTKFIALLQQLVDESIPFVCWASSDFRDLPLAVSFTEVKAEVLSQTVTQPAELFLQYRPRN